MARPRRKNESGYALLLVFLMAAVIAISLYKELPRIAFETQRQKEQLLVERGEQYKRALQLFVRVNKRWPAKIEDLENTNNMRYLRKRYTDPMTGKDEWRVIHAGPNGVLMDSKVNVPKGQEKEASAPSTYVGEVAGLGQTLQNTSGQGATQNPALRRRGSDAVGPGGPGAPGAIAGAGNPGDPNAPNASGAANPSGVTPQPMAGIAGIPPVMPGSPGATSVPSIPGSTPGGGFGGQIGANRPGMPPGVPGIPGSAPPGSQSTANSGGSSYLGSGNSYLGGASSVGSQPSSPSIPGQPNYNPGMPGMPGALPGYNPAGTPVNSQMGGVSPAYGTAPGANGTPPGFGQPGMNMNPQAQNAAAAMIGQILTQPRPGGMPQTNSNGMAAMGGGIAGFASTADQDSIMVYNDQTNYGLWEFVFDPAKVKPLPNPNGGTVGTPASQLASPAGTSPMGTPMNSPFGTPTQQPSSQGSFGKP